jgi:hypothetical protein
MSLTLLVLAAALHAGFQLTVTLVVYPALAAVPPEQWRDRHEAHSRAISPLVGVVYLVLAIGCGSALLTASGSVWVWATGGLAAATVLVTGLRAAPLHGRLDEDADTRLLRDLVRADRVRAVLAVAALATAVAALLTG